MNELIHVALTVLLVLNLMRLLLWLPLQPNTPQSAFYPASTQQQLKAPPHGQVGSLKHGTKQLQNSNYLFQLPVSTESKESQEEDNVIPGQHYNPLLLLLSEVTV